MPVLFLILGVIAIAALASSSSAASPPPQEPNPTPLPPGLPTIPTIPTLPPGIPGLPGTPPAGGSVPSGVPGIPSIPAGLPDNGIVGLPEPLPSVVVALEPSLTNDQLHTLADALDAAGQHKAANEIHAYILARTLGSVG